MKKQVLCFIIILFSLLPQIRFFTASGFFPMHDDTQVARVVAMGKALRNGQFPVRWVNDLGYGYGYPIFNFYGPLPYYVGGFLYAFGLSGIVATKIMIVIGIVLAGLVMYLCAAYFFGSIGGLIAAIAYVYMPYHAVQIYVRGAIGEYWATIFIPLIITGIIVALRKKNNIAHLIIGLGISGVVLSHTLLGYVSVLFVLLSIVLSGGYSLYKKSDASVMIIIYGIIVGLGISAFFWLPGFSEMKFTSVNSQVSSTADYKDHFVCIEQLWYSQWGFGGSQLGCTDGLSFALGKIFIVLASLGLVQYVIRFKNKKRNSLYIVIFGLLFLSLFFMLPYSSFFWNLIPHFEYLQYPWRFLSFTIVALAFLIGSISTVFHQTKPLRILVGIVIVGLTIWNGMEWSQPQYLYNKSHEEFETIEELRFRSSKVSDEYLPPEFIKPTSVDEIARSTIIDEPDLFLKQTINKETFQKFEFNPKVEKTITLQHAHFPGWIYIVNGKKQPLVLDQGKPVITIPGEFSTAEMKFVNTAPRIIGNLISFVFVVVLIYIYGKKTIT